MRLDPLPAPNHSDSSEYIEQLYSIFLNTLIRRHLVWRPNGKRLTLRRQPEIQGRHAIFWHVISGGMGEEAARTLDPERCRRIGWIGLVIEQFNRDWPQERQIHWWVSSRSRGSTKRYLITINDFSYIVVIDEKPDYAVLVTAYYVKQPHRQRKLRNEHAAYWSQQEPPL